MIDLSSIFTHCNSINAEVSIYRTTYAYTDDGERWLCSFTLKNEGSELKVQGRGATGDEAIRSAHEKLSSLLSAPPVCAALQIPALFFDGEVTHDA